MKIDDMGIGSGSYEYKGTPVCPEITIDGLVENRDFTVEYEDNDRPGVALAIVRGSGAYAGEVKKTFLITEEKDISSMKISLSRNTYTYNGKTHSPLVTIEGLTEGKDFKVTYSGNKYVGKASVKVTGIGSYRGTLTSYYQIYPKGTRISGLTGASKSLKVRWKKQSTQTTGYQIRCSRYSSMKSAKAVTVSKKSTTSKKITGLKSHRKYYVQIRTYKSVSGKKYYSAWSLKKSVKTK